jgi:hypothetical protein
MRDLVDRKHNNTSTVTASSELANTSFQLLMYSSVSFVVTVLGSLDKRDIAIFVRID